MFKQPSFFKKDDEEEETKLKENLLDFSIN